MGHEGMEKAASRASRKLGRAGRRGQLGLARRGAGRPHLARRRAQSIVEFAFVVPVLLAVLIGILEFGWLAKNTMTLSSAAREGARAAAVGKATQSVNEIITRYANPIALTGARGSITLQQCDSSGSACGAWPADDTSVTPPRNGLKPPSMARVTLVSYHQSLTGFVPGLNDRPLVSTVTIRREP